MESLLQDVKHSFRTWGRSPGFAALVVLILALGIGANTAIFSVVHAVVLRPLPYPEPDRLLVVHTVRPDADEVTAHSNSLPDYEDWRKEPGLFDRMALFTYWTFNLTGREVPERIVGGRVTGEFFPTLGAQPLLGRVLTAEDDQPDTPEAIVLSYGLWQSLFGGDRGALGRVLTFNGRPHTVAGVMGPEFRFPAEDVQLWAAVKDNMGGMLRHNRFTFVFGRLSPGMTLQRAQAAMDVIGRRLEQQYPESNKGYSVRLLTAHDTLVGKTRPALLVLLGAVACVLLIACANVGNLLLARASARHREYAIRAALGAGQGRLLRQFLTEHLLLALAGGALGAAAAQAGLKLLLQMHPGDIPRLNDVALDPVVLGFALLVTLLTGVALGLLPALQFARSDPQQGLKEGARSTGEKAHSRTRNALVVAEVALTVILLVGGGLLLRSFARLMAVEPGFATSHTMSMDVFLTPPGYRSIPERIGYLDRALANLREMGVVEATGVSTNPPLGDGWTSFSFHEEGRPLTVADSPSTGFRAVSEDYFQTLRIPLLAGRAFAATDRADAPRVVLVNESFARRMWPGGEAVGKRIRWSDPQRDVGPVTIVGVVRDIHNRGLEQEEGLIAYAPVRQVTFSWMRWFSFLVRTRGNPQPLLHSLRGAVLRADPEKPVFRVRTIEAALEASLAERRFQMLLLQMFAAVALLLAVVGIYGVVSYGVTQRTPEIGLRMALGAQRGDIVRWVVRGSMAWSLVGLAMGLAGSLALSRYMETLLFGVAPSDAATYVSVTLLLAAAALAACLLPALRASRVDPLRAIRHE